MATRVLVCRQMHVRPVLVGGDPQYGVLRQTKQRAWQHRVVYRKCWLRVLNLLPSPIASHSWQICVAVDDGSLPQAPPAQQRFVAALQVGQQHSSLGLTSLTERIWSQ